MTDTTRIYEAMGAVWAKKDLNIFPHAEIVFLRYMAVAYRIGDNPMNETRKEIRRFLLLASMRNKKKNAKNQYVHKINSMAENYLKELEK